MTTATTPKPAFVQGPLPILLSCRVRLSEEQRATLKQAYQRAKALGTPAQAPRIGGSSVTTVTAVNNVSLDNQLGMSPIVVADLLGSRDSIAVQVVLKLQTVLGVTVLTKEDVTAAAKSYVNYVFSSND